MNGKRDWGWLWLLLVLAFIGGIALKSCGTVTATTAPARNPLDVLDELFTHAICLVPLLTVLVPLTIWGGVRLYFFVQTQRLALQQRRAELEHLRRSVPQPQVVTDAQGRPVLVDPALATRAVTPLMGDEPVDSDRLRAAALLTKAAKRGGVIPTAASSPELDTELQRPRPELRIVDVEAVAPWLTEVRPQLAALVIQEEGSDGNY